MFFSSTCSSCFSPVLAFYDVGGCLFSRSTFLSASRFWGSGCFIVGERLVLFRGRLALPIDLVFSFKLFRCSPWSTVSCRSSGCFKHVFCICGYGNLHFDKALVDLGSLSSTGNVSIGCLPFGSSPVSVQREIRLEIIVFDSDKCGLVQKWRVPFGGL
ncbi:hypothetical protein DY000_02053026 [Brassica cretica]|uniref:Uncharacterized protein n=1 Tax=Brassica cretica TaxID=69181 RepID=A0ABQ7AAR0_BRACR|nr:hypothetical protein DY000_02053026 [Brassica cretica]